MKQSSHLSPSRPNVFAFPKEEELLPAASACPFCGRGEYDLVGTLQDDPQISLRSCLHCHLGYVDRQPTAEFLEGYYRSYYPRPEFHADNTTIFPEMMTEHLLKVLPKAALAPGDEAVLLDFGGGDGAVAINLARKLLDLNRFGTATVVVVDPNSTGGDTKDPRIRTLRQHDLQELSPGFAADYVLASASLEHVPDPRSIVDQLLSRVKPGGSFYARTPFIYPIFKLLGRFGLRVDVIYPEHLFDMGNRFWNGVLTVLGRDEEFFLSHSATSLVETRWSDDWRRALISHVMKAPSRLAPLRYPYVGGWEVVATRRAG